MDKPKKELPDRLKATQWKKGQSGNPKGRPSSTPLTEALKRELEDPAVAREMARAIIKIAKKGQSQGVAAFKEVGDRVEGKVAQRLDLVGDLSIDVNKDIVERLQSARKRVEKK